MSSLSSAVIYVGGGIADHDFPAPPQAVVDVSAWFLRAYALNHAASVKRVEANLLKVSAETVVERMSLRSKLDLLWASPPCTCWSQARGADRLCHIRLRPTLLKPIDYAAILRPKFIVVENVPGILTGEGPQWLGWLMEGLTKLGYNMATWDIDAIKFGGCQRRRRLFFVGVLNGTVPPQPEPKFKTPEKTLGDVIGSLPKEHLLDGCQSMSDSWRERLKDIKPGDPIVGSEYARLSMSGYCDPLRTKPCIQRDPMFVHPTEQRFLSVREYAAIMQVPDYKFPTYMSEHDRYYVVGQAVPPSLARAAVDRLIG